MDAVKAIDEVEIVTSVSGIELAGKDHLLAIYPNPAKDGVFYLQDPLNYMVFSSHGIKLQEGKGRIIDLSSQAKGMYILVANGKMQKLAYH